MNNPLKRQVKVESAAVRDILAAWDPVGGAPQDEYDCLVDHVVSAVHRGKTEAQDIAAVISSELVQHFGITASKESVLKVADEIASRLRSPHS